MITTRFNDRDIEHGSNAKAVRSWLRKHGLTIRDGRKDGNIWIFDCDAPGSAPTTRAARPVPVVSTPRPVPIVSAPRPVPIVSAPRPIQYLPVAGSDLRPFDSIMNFVDGIHLTIDYRGIHEIRHEPENITRKLNVYQGFYSMESDGMSSFKIDPEVIYDVRR